MSIEDLIVQLYKHVHTGEPPGNVPYSCLDFYLDEQGYQYYLQILRTIYWQPGISETWSESAMWNQFHWLLVELAEKKSKHENQESYVDFASLARKWKRAFQSHFDEHDYGILVYGLVLEKPMTLGKVTLWPLSQINDEANVQKISQVSKDLNYINGCLASSPVSAESGKAAEILRHRVEEVLNVLRYLGAIVWYDQPPRHIYLAGEEPKRTYSIFTREGKNWIKQLRTSLFTPTSYNVNEVFINIAEYVGFRDIFAWMVNPEVTPFQKLLLNSIQWFGDATQDLITMQAFMKYYIAVEALLKKNDEKAREVLPNRVTNMLGEQNGTHREVEVKELIRERNNIFHTGSPKNKSPDELEWIGHGLARNVINKIIQMVKTFKCENKNAFLEQLDKEWGKTARKTY